MKNRLKKFQFLVLLGIHFLMVSPNSAIGEVKGSFLYKLSNFTGTIPYSWVRPFVDKEKNEIYVSNGADRSVRIFNENGMEVYNFGDDENLGNILDGAVDNDGNILALSYTLTNNGASFAVIRCNFRGEPKSKLEIKNLPSDFSEFLPNRLIYREGHLYLADRNRMKVVVTNAEGLFKEGYDIASLLGLDEKERAESGMVGFNVNKEGNILFTVPVHFRAYKLSPDRKIESFGKKGSAPGRFGVVAGIISDEKGYIYVADTLRCVVMIFDKDFRFQNEFGYRGFRPGNLIAPMDIEVDGNSKVYVTQSARRGISVYKITYN